MTARPRIGMVTERLRPLHHGPGCERHGMALLAAGLGVLLAAGCGDDGSPADAGTDAGRIDAGSLDATVPDGMTPDTAVPDGSPDDAVLPDAPPVDGAADNPCKAAGGICLGAGAGCTMGGGTPAPAGDPGCVFDDGAGVCCVPPTAQPSGETCESQGGLCAPIAGCNFVDGSFAPSTDCTGVPIVCCVPEDICGPEDVVCCAPGPDADFRPFCVRGTFQCDEFPGTTLTPIADCT